MGIPSLERGCVGEDVVGERGLLAVVDIDGDVQGDECFVREDFARHVGFGISKRRP